MSSSQLLKMHEEREESERLSLISQLRRDLDSSRLFLDTLKQRMEKSTVFPTLPESKLLLNCWGISAELQRSLSGLVSDTTTRTSLECARTSNSDTQNSTGE